jgi:hypothetical protein
MYPKNRAFLQAVVSAVLAVGILASCTVPAGPRAAVGHASRITRRVRLIDEPRNIRDDFAYPQDQTRQTFAWGHFGGEWRVNLADRRYAYAGFVFKKPYDFSHVQDTTALSFRLRPSGIDEHLSVALVDGSNSLPRVLADVPLSSHRVWERGGWGLYAVRLDQFNVSVRLDRGKTGKNRAVDWSDINEIRLITRTHRTWDGDIIIRDLQFGPLPWGLQKKKAVRKPPRRFFPSST